MADLKDVIYLSNEDYNTLVSTGTVTIDGTTLTYDENCMYITPDQGGGGDYLPLSAGSSYPLTGDLYAQGKIFANGYYTESLAPAIIFNTWPTTGPYVGIGYRGTQYTIDFGGVDRSTLDWTNLTMSWRFNGPVKATGGFYMISPSGGMVDNLLGITTNGGSSHTTIYDLSPSTNTIEAIEFGNHYGGVAGNYILGAASAPTNLTLRYYAISDGIHRAIEFNNENVYGSIESKSWCYCFAFTNPAHEYTPDFRYELTPQYQYYASYGGNADPYRQLYSYCSAGGTFFTMTSLQTSGTAHVIEIRPVDGTWFRTFGGLQVYGGLNVDDKPAKVGYNENIVFDYQGGVIILNIQTASIKTNVGDLGNYIWYHGTYYYASGWRMIPASGRINGWTDVIALAVSDYNPCMMMAITTISYPQYIYNTCVSNFYYCATNEQSSYMYRNWS